MKQASPSRRAALSQSLALAAAGVACATGAASAAQSPASPNTYRAAFQVSDADPAKWGLTLNNIRNAQHELGAEHTKIELVVFGPGIGMLMAASETAGRVSEAIKSGVVVSACENTMRGQKLTREQMNPGIGYVPSGVAHLIRRQTEGYAYIRS
jgi:intracellular sulfur oxidation DsrE/DsrF family protein